MCCNLQLKTLRYSNGCLTFVALIVLVVILVLSVVSSLGYSNGIIFLEAAINWSREPILNITPVDPKTGKCVNDNQPIFEYQFKGMSQGCDCSTPTQVIVTSGSCSSSQSTCKTVKSVSELTLSNWIDGSANPVRLCFQRLPGYKYYQKFLSDSKCRDPVNEKMCGGSDPMTAFCVPKTSKCPVQSLSMTQINPTDEQVGTIGLWMQRDIPNKSHLSESQVGEKGICTDYQDKYIDNITNKYKLLKDSNFRTCSIDNQFSKIVDINALDFYKANNLDASSFPGLVNNKQMGIFQRQYIYWKMECRKGNEFNDLVNIALDYYTDYSNHQMIFKVAAANLAYIFVYALLLMCGCFTTQINRKWCTFRECCKIDCCCCCCMKKGCTFNGCNIRAPQCLRKMWMRKDDSSSCCDYLFLVDPLHILLIVIKFILDILMLALAVVNFSKVNSYKTTLADLSKMNCSTNDVNSSLTSTSDSIKSLVIPLDAVVLALTIIYFLGSFWAVCVYLSNQVNRRRECIKQKLDLKQVKVLDDNDQTIPTINSSNNISNHPNPIPNQNNIQMSQFPLNPANPYPQHQNPYTQPQTTQPLAPYPVQQQAGYVQPMYPPPQQTTMYPPQQPTMYPPQQPTMYPPQQGVPVYYKPN